MAEGTFAHATWIALSAVEDHFARIGGQNRYPGFEVTHPALFVVALLAANVSEPRSTLKPTSAGVQATLGRLETEAPSQWQALRALEPWNPARFPQPLLTAVSQQITGLCPTAADIRGLQRQIDHRLPTLGSMEREGLRGAFRALAALCDESAAPAP